VVPPLTIAISLSVSSRALARAMIRDIVFSFDFATQDRRARLFLAKMSKKSTYIIIFSIYWRFSMG
jgi:hypothetical protein